MNLHGKAILVHLQEDDAAHAFFRIHPLMTDEGDITSESLTDFPDEGYLRVVPDRNEQHAFKDRMRSLSGLCLMDLRGLTSDAHKIRTNKNYSVANQELNRYIVYSDAIKRLPDDLVYQVVSEDGIATALTPHVYIRKGANIQGPFKKEDAAPIGDIRQLPPDSAEIKSLSFEGQEMLFYWPVQTQTEASSDTRVKHPVQQNPKTQETSVPKAKESPTETAIPLRIPETAEPITSPVEKTLPVEKELEPLPALPLSGTRFYQAAHNAASNRRARNPLSEAVEQQRSVTRLEAPGALLSHGASPRDVHNPVELFKRSLQEVVQTQDYQRHAVELLAAQPEICQALSKLLAKDDENAIFSATHNQLQELEAERLQTLMQLDELNKNVLSAKEKLSAELVKEKQFELKSLEETCEQKSKQLEVLQQEAVNWEQKRQEAAAIIEAAEQLNHRVLLAPALGEEFDREALVQRVLNNLTTAGFAATKADAVSLLTVFALSQGRFELQADTAADACDAAKAFSAALGASICLRAEMPLSILAGGDAPAFILHQGEQDTLPSEATYISAIGTSQDEQNWEGFWTGVPRGRITLHLNLDCLPSSIQISAPVTELCIRQLFNPVNTFSADIEQILSSLRHSLAKLNFNIPAKTCLSIAQFIAATKDDFDGGIAEAADRAALSYLVPLLLASKLSMNPFYPVFSAMPLSLKAITHHD